MTSKWSGPTQARDTPISAKEIMVYARSLVDEPQPLQDGRCPICLGDIYTCECGKARR